MDEQRQEVTGDGEEVFLTGASGFVGSHVLHALLAARYRVRALVRPGSRALPTLEGCVPVWGDVQCAGDLVQPMRGCRYLVHVAALYSLSPGMQRQMVATNVRGCAGVLEAARLAGIERAVVTSSSATVGPAHGGHPATERDQASETGSAGYHLSKLQQERVALAARVPVVLVLPTAPVGPGDWKPTPTGKMVVDFLRGRIFATLASSRSERRYGEKRTSSLVSVQAGQATIEGPDDPDNLILDDGGLNVVAVEDVARAHVLALQRGRLRERYLVGGENLSFAQLWERLAQTSGRAAPTVRIPPSLALALGWVDELRCRLLSNGKGGMAAPLIPLEGVRMACHPMYASSAKARSELGYTATSVNAALERAVRWYRDNGYVR